MSRRYLASLASFASRETRGIHLGRYYQRRKAADLGAWSALLAVILIAKRYLYFAHPVIRQFILYDGGPRAKGLLWVSLQDPGLELVPVGRLEKCRAARVVLGLIMRRHAHTRASVRPFHPSRRKAGDANAARSTVTKFSVTIREVEEMTRTT